MSRVSDLLALIYPEKKKFTVAERYAQSVARLGNGRDRADRPTLIHRENGEWIARVSGGAGWMEVNFSQLAPDFARLLALWIQDTFEDRT